MTVSPVIPNTVEVRLLWSLAGNLAINVLHAIAPGAYTVDQTTTNTLAAAIKSAMTSNLAVAMPPNVQLVRVGQRDLRTANRAEFLDTGAAAAGVTAGDMLPPSVASMVTLRTASSGKSFRGRVYIGGFLEASNDANGTAGATSATAAVNFMVGVQGAMTASGLQLAVASRPAEEKILVETTNHNDGTSTVRTVSHTKAKAGQSTAVNLLQSRNAAWETQRRRGNGRGALPGSLIAVREAAI